MAKIPTKLGACVEAIEDYMDSVLEALPRCTVKSEYFYDHVYLRHEVRIRILVDDMDLA